MPKSRISLAAICICIVACIFFLWKAFFTNDGYSDGDSITHYLIAHHAFTHPKLLLHLWGKPFFTLCSAPFAWFGFNGIQVFNILCAIASGWLAFKVAQKLKIPLAPAAVIFTLAAPVYYVNVATGLTEIFFGLVLIASVYLALQERYFLAALLVSFLPFCRSEGFLILPLFGLFLLFAKQYKALPLLAFGTLFYSITGYFYYDDIAWVFNQNPYKEVSIYGHGELLYFVQNTKTITGLPLSYAFVAGLLYIFYRTYMQFRKNAFSNEYAAEILLLFGSFLVYFVAHTIFWWKGIFGSLGMTRVIAGVVPVFAVCALSGFSLVQRYIQRRSVLIGGMLALIFIYIVIITPYKLSGLQEAPERRLETVQEACNWLEENNISKDSIFYSHPFTVICMDIDPYAEANSRDLMFTPTEILPDVVPNGNYIVWDSQFGPNEMHTPLQKLQDTANFSFVKNFAPPEKIPVLGGGIFEVKIFRRK